MVMANIYETLKEWLAFAGLLGLSFIVVVGLNKYGKWSAEQPKQREIVFACPEDESVKCYELQAEYEVDCPGEYRENCSYVYNKIYFPNGDYISFEYCTDYDKDRLLCYPEDDSEANWVVQDTGRKTVEKYAR